MISLSLSLSIRGRVTESSSPSVLLCLKTMDKVPFMAGVFWSVPKTMDQLRVQWPTLTDGVF